MELEAKVNTDWASAGEQQRWRMPQHWDWVWDIVAKEYPNLPEIMQLLKSNSESNCPRGYKHSFAIPCNLLVCGMYLWMQNKDIAAALDMTTYWVSNRKSRHEKCLNRLGDEKYFKTWEKIKEKFASLPPAEK